MLLFRREWLLVSSFLLVTINPGTTKIIYLSFKFLCPNFLAPKNDHHIENQPVLGHKLGVSFAFLLFSIFIYKPNIKMVYHIFLEI